MNFEKIREIANKKTTRAVATALLILAGKVSSANSELGTKSDSDLKVKAGAGKEILALNTEKESSAADKNAYLISGKDMLDMEVANNFELVKIDFDVNYETDKASLAEEPKAEIIKQFATFLGSINKDNFPAVKEADWEVVSSCDERPTNVWGEKGNEALATARGEAVINLLQKDLKNYKFSGLSDEQIKFLKDKAIENAIVTTHENRKGETLITDIVNPETGNNYTETETEEIKKNDPDKYFSLLAQNRISQFRAEIPVVKLEKMGLVSSPKPIPEKAPRLENIETPDLKGLVKIFPEYKNIILLLDNSPSMRDDKKMLSQEIEAQQGNLVNTNFYIGHYSNKLQKLSQANNTKVGAEIIADIGLGSDKEASIQAPLEAWDKIGSEINPEEKTLILVNTDEALQGVSAAVLKKITDLPENVEVKFVFHIGEGNCLKVPLNVVCDNFNKVMDKKTSSLKKHLSSIEQQLAKLHLRQLNNADANSERHLHKMIQSLEKQQTDCIARMVDINEYYANKKISLSEFTNVYNQDVTLNIY